MAAWDLCGGGSAQAITSEVKESSCPLSMASVAPRRWCGGGLHPTGLRSFGAAEGARPKRSPPLRSERLVICVVCLPGLGRRALAKNADPRVPGDVPMLGGVQGVVSKVGGGARQV